jgi:glycosyltransferase involved in cell wall biosynthesis
MTGLKNSLRRAKRWLLKYGAPEGTFRRKALLKGVFLAQAYLLNPVRARLGGWAEAACAPLDIYQSEALNAFLKECSSPPLEWSPAATEQDDFGAARFALGMLQERPELRRQFPGALTEGEAGGYCRWLCSAGMEEFGLAEATATHFRAAFARNLGHRIRQFYDFNTQLPLSIPLALTPGGQRQMLRWLLFGARSAYELRDEEIWWFLFETAEDPYKGVAATYLRLPAWQQRFPCGLTAFGQGPFLAWLRKRYHIRDGWLDGLDLSGYYHPVDQLRQHYAATPALQRLAPRAFRDRADTDRLVRWLRAEGGAGLSPAWWERFETGLADGLAGRRGVNVVGYLCYRSGLGEAAHATVRGLHSAGVRTSSRDVPNNFKDGLPRSEYLGLETFGTTLLHIAPEPLVHVCYPAAGLKVRRGVYRIAVWYWELEAVPKAWRRHARVIQEIWAPTQFIARAMRAVMPIPVIDMLPGLQLGHVPSLPRSHFGLPEDRFLFFFMFDMCSVMERKNPLAVIRAFRKAFGPDERVALAVKVSRGYADPDGFERLRRAAGEAGVTVIDQMMTREESYGLMNACDAYVSLHRSEGFGLTMAEAMLMGKPTIATAYSGNVDFMKPSNSLLVDFARVPITQDLPFYRKGCLWAEPSVEQAAAHMRWLYDHPVEARALGERARKETEEILSIRAAGQRMVRRLEEIHGQRRGGSGRTAA